MYEGAEKFPNEVKFNGCVLIPKIPLRLSEQAAEVVPIDISLQIERFCRTKTADCLILECMSSGSVDKTDPKRIQTKQSWLHISKVRLEAGFSTGEFEGP